ncbi:MAG: hypothetical protein J6P45_05640 [Lachnospiraceae bacterium]|nr:hypothetical protein [Lachnospiraceae bacterium]
MSVFALKLFALISMIIDHMGYVIFPQYRWMRYVGRLAFPIYAFLITEGYIHTRNVKKYLLRLGVFAVISEVPFDLAFSGVPFDKNYQNVFFTLLLGLIALIFIDFFAGQTYLQCLSVLALCSAAQFMGTDYRYIGVCLIVVFYLFRDRKPFKMVGAANALIPFSSNIECMALVSMIPVFLYNGKPGRFKWKYFFYVIYPAHLLVLSAIRDFYL